MNRGGFIPTLLLDENFDSIFIIIHFFKLQDLILAHQEKPRVFEKIKKSLKLYSLYFGVAVGTILTPIPASPGRHSRGLQAEQHLVLERAYSSVNDVISENTAHIRKIQVGDKIIVLGSNPLVQKKKWTPTGPSKLAVSKKKRCRAKMVRFSDLPRISEFSYEEETSIVLPQKHSSRLRK